MKNIIVLAKCGNGYCGCDSEDVFFFNANCNESEIQEVIWDWACDNAESYSPVHFGWGEEYEDEDWEEYLENYVDCNWHIASYEEYVEWCENWDYEPKAKEDI